MDLPKIFQQKGNGLLGLTPYGAPAPYLRLDTANPDPSAVVGSTYWDASEDTAVTHRSNGKAYVHGSELWKRCINKTGSDIPNGTPVYVVGAQGDRPKIAPAGATTAAKSRVLGVTTETIENNAEGDVLIEGDLNDVDTTSYTLGDEVWLGATDGTIVNAAPGNGHQRVFLGIVTRIHATAGRIQISPYRYPMASELIGASIRDFSTSLGAGDPLQTGVHRYVGALAASAYLPAATGSREVVRIRNSASDAVAVTIYPQPGDQIAVAAPGASVSLSRYQSISVIDVASGLWETFT